MTKESHQRASEILPLIENAKAHLNKWEAAISFKDDAEIGSLFNYRDRYTWLSAKHIPFDLIKPVVIDRYRKEIKALEDEFNAL